MANNHVYKKTYPHISTAKNGLNMIKPNIHRSSEPIGGHGGGSLLIREAIKAEIQDIYQVIRAYWWGWRWRRKPDDPGANKSKYSSLSWIEWT